MKHIKGSNTSSILSHVRFEDIQPNAVDLRVNRIFSIDDNSTVELSEDTRVHALKQELVCVDGWFKLPKGQYEIIMENNITVGENEAGIVIPRSTLNRNGIFITSGLYDSGYSGTMAAALHCTRGLNIKRGTRIAQFVLFNAEMLHKYDGHYGVGKQHDIKTYGSN